MRSLIEISCQHLRVILMKFLPVITRFIYETSYTRKNSQILEKIWIPRFVYIYMYGVRFKLYLV